MRAECDLGCDLIKMKLHGLAVAGRQHEGGAGPQGQSSGTEPSERAQPEHRRALISSWAVGLVDGRAARNRSTPKQPALARSILGYPREWRGMVAGRLIGGLGQRRPQRQGYEDHFVAETGLGRQDSNLCIV